LLAQLKGEEPGFGVCRQLNYSLTTKSLFLYAAPGHPSTDFPEKIG
jgi:hypothetical protein